MEARKSWDFEILRPAPTHLWNWPRLWSKSWTKKCSDHSDTPPTPYAKIGSWGGNISGTGTKRAISWEPSLLEQFQDQLCKELEWKGYFWQSFTWKEKWYFSIFLCTLPKGLFAWPVLVHFLWKIIKSQYILKTKPHRVILMPDLEGMVPELLLFLANSQKWQYLENQASQSNSETRFGKSLKGKAAFDNLPPGRKFYFVHLFGVCMVWVHLFMDR